MENRKEIRVWTDACFDVPHFGHANALRQARELGDKLILGVHSDEEIKRHKGPTVFNEQERYRMARAIRWVDEVVEDAPYSPSLATLDKYNCDFGVHGDDIVIGTDGVDIYKELKDVGRFRVFPRTPGISTTDLIGRLILATRVSSGSAAEESPETVHSPYTGGCNFCTSGLIAQFCENRRKRQPSDKVVYVDGSFDIFHMGHLAFLEAAATQGTHLIVGVHPNQIVSSYKGVDRPILSLHERVLSILAYRCVDDVIIGAPYKVTSELLDTFKVDLVLHGSRTPILRQSDASYVDPYEVPKRRGIFKLIDSGSEMTTDSLLERIYANRELYRERNRKKEAKEVKLIAQAKAKV